MDINKRNNRNMHKTVYNNAHTICYMYYITDMHNKFNT